jgi:hypothetical protein
MKAMRKQTAARPNNPPITPPAMDPADVPVAPVLSTGSAVGVESALSSIVGVTSRKELRTDAVVGILTTIGMVVVADVLDEAELTVLDIELEELEDGVMNVDVGVGFWLVVEGVGRGVLVVCEVGGGVEVEVGSEEGEGRPWSGGGLLLATGGRSEVVLPLPLSFPGPWRTTSMR